MAASDYLDVIQKIYIAYLGRPADPEGLAYWAKQADAQGGDLSSIVAGFSQAAESLALYSGQTTDEIITAIYDNLFNRTPDDAGLQYWRGQVSEGKLSLAQAAQAILNGAMGTDAVSVSNKFTIANAFTAQIDTPAEISGYAGSASFDYTRSFLKTVGSDPASLTAANDALTDAVFTATNTGTSTPPGQTFTLTAGVDIFTGTDGSDTFNSTVAGGFGTGDSINGGGGSDRLVVNDPGSIVLPDVTVTNVESASFTTVGALALDTTAWTGLTTLTTNMTNGSTTLVAGAGTAVKVTSTGDTPGYSNNDIYVTGGSSVEVTQLASNDVNTTHTMGSVTVVGGVNTSSVKITNAKAATPDATTVGVIDNYVYIQDREYGIGSTTVGHIHDISVANFQGLQIWDNALTKLSLVGSANAGYVFIQNDSALQTNQKTTTLDLTLDGVAVSHLQDQNVYTTLNITTTGSASTLTNVFDSALTTLTVKGTQALTLTTNSTNLTNVDASGLTQGDFTWTSAALTGSAISVKGSATGTNTIDIDAGSGELTYQGSSGSDAITLKGSGAAQLNFGTGHDTLVLENQSSANDFATITGFTIGDLDTIDFSHTNGFNTLTSQSQFGAKVTAGVDFNSLLDEASATDVSTSTSLQWFQSGGDTYIVHDVSANSTFTAGTDTLIKLVGLYDLNDAHVSIHNGVVTFDNPNPP